MESSSDAESCTPPDVAEAAKNVTLKLLPPKSREKYETTYKNFMDWRNKEKIASSFSENVLLAYFGQLSEKIAPNTLWTVYSMLRSTLAVHQNIDITKYMKLRSFLKRQSSGYKPKKSKVLMPEEINRFLNEAPDDKYLFHKVLLIIGISGACRKHELLNLKVEDIEELNSAAIIRIPDTKNNKPRTFTITGKFFEIYKKYSALRPPNLKGRFFLNYQHKKCTRQPVGINKIGSVPKLIACYLTLKDPHLYTGHCYRRSSATLLVDAGGDITALKRHGGWLSTSVAEGYVEESIQNKMKVANTILNTVNPISENEQAFEPIGSFSEIPGTSTAASPPPRSSTASTAPINVSSDVTENNLQSVQHPINFVNCTNNQITINFINNQ